MQYQNSTEDTPRFTDRAARSLIKLFNIDDVSWQQEMDLIEKLIKESEAMKTEETVPNYDMNHLTGLRYRLKAVGGHNHPVREVGVQHRAGAKVMKMKMAKSCKNCCCAHHCQLTGHERCDVGLDNAVNTVMEYKFPTMLDNSWDDFEAYKQGVYDTLPIVEDNLMSLLVAVNTDFSEVKMETEPDCLG